MIHPNILLTGPRIQLVLSDLHQLFSTISIQKKLLFYLSAMAQLDRNAWLALEKDVSKDINELLGESSLEI